MADSKDDTNTTTVGMHLPEETADRIRKQADQEHRSVSSLLKSIVLPEIDRRQCNEEGSEAVPA